LSRVAWRVGVDLEEDVKADGQAPAPCLQSKEATDTPSGLQLLDECLCNEILHLPAVLLPYWVLVDQSMAVLKSSLVAAVCVRLVISSSVKLTLLSCFSAKNERGSVFVLFKINLCNF
jgi:hypothetical protein